MLHNYFLNYTIIGNTMGRVLEVIDIKYTKYLFVAKHHEVRHYRNDNLARTLRYHHYDSHFQPYLSLNVPIHFMAQDKITFSCQINSMAITKTYTVRQL